MHFSEAHVFNASRTKKTAILASSILGKVHRLNHLEKRRNYRNKAPSALVLLVDHFRYINRHFKPINLQSLSPCLREYYFHWNVLFPLSITSLLLTAGKLIIC